MNCTECREILLSWLDHSMPPYRQVSAHLTGCAECRTVLAAVERLREGLNRRRPVDPPAELADRICRRWQRECRLMRVRRWLRVSAAAAVVLCLGVWGIWQLHRPGPQPQVRQPPDTAPPALPPIPVAAATIRTPVVYAGQGFASFGTEFTASFARQAKPLATSLPDTRLPIADAEIPLGRVSRLVAVGLEPLLDSAREGLLLLFRNSPPPASPEPPPGDSGVPAPPATP
jgi:predicted anti-sigma-YlaC factor YlaD